MALTAKVLTGTLSITLNGTTDFTSSGFGTPDAALVFISNAQPASNPSTTLVFSVGFWDGTNQHAQSVYAANSADITLTARYLRTDRVAVVGNWSGATHTILAEYTASNITDGVRLTLSVDNTGAQRQATVVLLKGVTHAKVGTFAHGGNTNANNITSVGFKPDLVFMLSTGLTSAGDSSGSYLSMGVAHNSGADVVTQHCVVYASTSNVDTSAVNTSVNDDCVERVYYDDGVVDRKTTISDFDADGFTVQLSAGTSSALVVYCALELPDPDDAYLDIVDSRTSTGTSEPYTGTGFTPILLGLFGNTDTATNSSSSSPTGAMSYGWTDGSTEQCVIVGDEDNLGTSNVFSRYDASNILNLRFDDDTVDAVASLDSFDSDGFTLDYSDASASARKMLVVALGNSATVSLPTLSAPTLISAGGNTYQPRVTATYS